MKTPARVISLLAVALGGCLGSAPPTPKNWMLDAAVDAKVKYVVVNAPYDGRPFTVLRADGTVAFDRLNVFAAAPSSLLKGRVTASDGVGTLTVEELCLDCRRPGERLARVCLRLEGAGRSRTGSASVSAADGNYSRAFTAAFVQAYGRLFAAAE